MQDTLFVLLNFAVLQDYFKGDEAGAGNVILHVLKSAHIYNHAIYVIYSLRSTIVWHCQTPTISLQ